MTRIVNSFDIKKLPFKTTLIRQITKQHLTHINNVYWMHKYSASAVKSHFHLVNSPPASPYNRNILQNQEHWERGSIDFGLWVRQNIIISAASILEVYIVAACTVVFSAWPELIDRSLLGVNSATYIKHPSSLPSGFSRELKKRAEDPTKGEWVDRIKKLSMEIGRVPEGVKRLAPKLQILQHKRNRIAHSYGAEGELRRTPWEPITAISAEEAEILETFKIIDAVSKDLDKDLFGPLIGGYEMLNEYHSWLSKQNHSSAPPRRTLISGFRKYIGQSFGQTPASEYIESLIIYYDNVGPPR